MKQTTEMNIRILHNSESWQKEIKYLYAAVSVRELYREDALEGDAGVS